MSDIELKCEIKYVKGTILLHLQMTCQEAFQPWVLDHYDKSSKTGLVQVFSTAAHCKYFKRQQTGISS